MFRLTLNAYSELVVFDRLLERQAFADLYERVRNCPIAPRTLESYSEQTVCSAVDLACIWYWKRVYCLQRSAATACLLKRCGIPARMILGAQHVPFRAHAWVEVGDRVVNDKPYTREIYFVLDVCS